ncbi:MAG: cytochrome P450 [Pseudomonadales bacterium]|nr:cytochrome P450 [Pseudomonadales bacterium]
MTSAQDYNPFSKETIECPYDFYAAMRNESPVMQVADGVFFVSSYDLIRQVLVDTKRFSSSNGAAFLNFQGEQGLAPPTMPPPDIANILAQGPRPRNTLLTADPPEHTRYRSLVNRSLSPRRVAKLEPAAIRVADALIDTFIDRGEVDLVEEFTQMVPLTVVAIALGVPEDQLENYKRWSMDAVKVLAGTVSHEERIESAQASVDLSNFLAQQVEQARKNPQGGLVEDLINAHMLLDEDVDGGQDSYRGLDTDEIVSVLNQLLIAGQETVNYLLSSTLLLLLQNPEHLARVEKDHGLIPAVLEEALRLESPIQSIGRFVLEDLELGGIAIPKGARLVILYGCGNRDENRFEDAATFSLNRTDARNHVGFGAGPHYCVGANLARMESRIALERLFARITNLQPTGELQQLSHQYNFIFRALNALPLRFDKKPAPDEEQEAAL